MTSKRHIPRLMSFAVIIGLALYLTSCGGGGDAPPPSENTGENTGVLGYGTNAFGKYASSENVLGQVLKVDALNDSGMVSLNDLDVEEAHYKTISGTTLTEYSSDFGADIGLSGSYKYFSASIRTNFETSHYQSQEYSFASESEQVWKKELKIKNEYQYAQTLKDYLTPVAAEAIANWAPKDIFKSYGTHVMVGVYNGARLDYNLSIRIENEEDTQNLEIFTKAAYKGLFASATLDASISSEVKTRMMQYQRSSSIDVVGGSVQYSNFSNCDEDNLDVCNEERSLWLASIDERPVFCNIMQNGLIPIWEFADGWDPEAGNCAAGSRCEQIKSEYIEYAKRQDDYFLPRELAKISHFDADREDWTSIGATGPNWHDNGYNESTFGGHLEAVDGSTSPWYFKAEVAKYTGDMSQFYGGELSYHFRWWADVVSSCKFKGKNSDYDTLYGDWWKPDVELEGSNGVKLGYFFGNPPDEYVGGLLRYNTWQQYVIPISGNTDSPAGYGWIKWCGTPPCYERATEADVKQVLQDVSGIMIRGEYCFGDQDRGLLDEVKLEASDADGDNVFDVEDNCPDTYNPLQEDSDGDGIGDACTLF